MTVATATGLVATVDVAHEAGVRRIGPRTDGADLTVVTGRPLRLAILVGRDFASLIAARAAALAGCADVVVTLTADSRSTFVERAAALRDARPDAVLVVSDATNAGGVVDLVEALRLGCASQRTAPTVLVAADERTRERIAASAAPFVVEAMPGPAGPGAAAAREAIAARLRGIRRPSGDVVLRDEAVESAARALAAADGRSALVLDVCGTSTSVALATAAGAVTAAHEHLGVGTAADRLVSRAGLDRVRRWIPRPIDAPALLERLYNRARWPDALAASTLTLELEMALAREAIAQLLRDADRAGLPLAALRGVSAITCTGRLAAFPRAAQTVLAALDGLAPEGTLTIAREHPDALLAAGAIATRTAAPVAGTTDALALVASLWPKRSASVTVTDASVEIVERVARGAFFLVPTNGAVELRITGVSDRVTAAGLALGVVVDARGRPLELPPRDAERLPALARWNAALAAIPVDWRAS